MSVVDQVNSRTEGQEADYDAMMEKGRASAASLEYGQALRAFDKALKTAQKMTDEERSVKVARARNGYAEACLVVGRWDRAQRELRRTVDSELGGEETVNAYLGLGTVLSRRGERDEARDYFTTALELAREIGNQRLEAVTLCNLGANSGRTGEMDDAQKLIDTAQELYSQLDDHPDNPQVAALVEAQYGLFHFRAGHNEQAERHFEKALRALGGKPSLEEAAVRRYQGVMAGLRQHHREALNCHLEALRIYKQAGCRYGQAKVYDSIGRTFLSVNRMEEAIFAFKKSEAICRRLGANSELATLYGKLGQVYMIREDYETAVKYFRRDLDISSRFRNFYALGYSYRNLGRSLIQVGIVEEAITNLKESLGLFQYVEDAINLGRVYMDLCQAYVKAERPSEARDVGRKASSIFKDNKMERELAYLTALHGTIHRLEGEFEEAESCLRQAIERLPAKGGAAWRAETHYELGVLYRQQDRLPEAVSAFRDALRIARDAGLNRQTGRYLRDIESLDETELFRAWMEDLPS